MNTYNKAVLAALLTAAPMGMFGFGVSVNVATANCKQNQTLTQTVNCGNINAPLNITTTGGGNVYFGQTTCNIMAGQSASQNAICTAIAG